MNMTTANIDENDQESTFESSRSSSAQPVMARQVVQPVESDLGYSTHPAWAVISASRVSSGGGGTVLFDSDVRHRHYIAVKLSRADRKRDLHHDWIHPREEIVEVVLSEAQWASFVSSMNSGSGVPVTLKFDRTQEDPRVPEVPFEPRLAESIAEVRGAAQEASAEVAAALQAYKDHKTVGNLRSLEAKIANLPANLEFAASSLNGHAENVVQRAKADIEAFVVAKATQLGIEPGEVGMLELSAGESTIEGEEVES